MMVYELCLVLFGDEVFEVLLLYEELLVDVEKMECFYEYLV